MYIPHACNIHFVWVLQTTMTVGTTVEADTSDGTEGSVLGGSPGGMAVMAVGDYLEVRYLHGLINIYLHVVGCAVAFQND